MVMREGEVTAVFISHRNEHIRSILGAVSALRSDSSAGWHLEEMTQSETKRETEQQKVCDSVS